MRPSDSAPGPRMSLPLVVYVHRAGSSQNGTEGQTLKCNGNNYTHTHTVDLIPRPDLSVVVCQRHIHHTHQIFLCKRAIQCTVDLNQRLRTALGTMGADQTTAWFQLLFQLKGEARGCWGRVTLSDW